nr:uncharacterized protein LOC127346589 [Lolium perenne]
MCWKLPLPDAFCGYEDCYVSADDRLTILCTVEVLKEEASATAAEPTKSFVSAVPPPTIAGDIHKLLLLLEKNPESSDVTFVVEDTEILAHRLVLAMRSPVFAAELLGHMRESTTRRVQIHDMSASTFKAMLRFIYSDEFPVKPNNVVHVESRSWRSLKEEPTPMSRQSMARDLLVAADRYDLERLRLMCESILVESIDITTVMPTLQLVRGRQSCLQLEDSCIEYIAADPDVYAAVRATEEYKELKETCSSLVIEVNERVATHNMARHTSSPSPSSSSRQPPEKSMSMFNSSQVVRGTHEFRIPNFSSVQRSHGPGQVITSNIFKRRLLPAAATCCSRRHLPLAPPSSRRATLLPFPTSGPWPSSRPRPPPIPILRSLASSSRPHPPPRPGHPPVAGLLVAPPTSSSTPPRSTRPACRWVHLVGPGGTDKPRVALGVWARQGNPRVALGVSGDLDNRAPGRPRTRARVFLLALAFPPPARFSPLAPPPPPAAATCCSRCHLPLAPPSSRRATLLPFPTSGPWPSSPSPPSSHPHPPVAGLLVAPSPLLLAPAILPSPASSSRRPPPPQHPRAVPGRPADGYAVTASS